MIRAVLTMLVSLSLVASFSLVAWIVVLELSRDDD